MASPYPKPVEVKIREGNPGKRRLPEPMLVAGRPRAGEMDEPPEFLPADAKEFWRTTVTQLAAIGLVDRIDGPALEMLATMYARVRQAARVVASDGHFSLGSVGQVREHPAVKIERESMVMFLRFAEQFGMTAVSRTRLGMAELHGRALAQELRDAFGPTTLRPLDDIDGTAD